MGSIIKPDTGKVVWMLAGAFVLPVVLGKLRKS